jgi:sulfofructosephosphate aldolase
MALLNSTRASLYGTLAGGSGAFAMVAMDQRESLRTMMQAHRQSPVEDEELAQFKLLVVEALSPYATAVLLDTQLGMRTIIDPDARHPDCALIVAVDALQQERGQPVESTSLDRSVDPSRLRELGASALKLLVLWKEDGTSAQRQDMVGEFIQRAHEAELLALVEPVVRPHRAAEEGWDREAAILEAAREIGPLGADIYKAEVPLHGRGGSDEITRRCRELTEILPCPWVVLSQGVEVEDFPGAVEAACRGGASGFLAGRAVWSDIVGKGEVRRELSRVSVPRLQALRSTVDSFARPWTDVLGPA